MSKLFYPTYFQFSVGTLPWSLRMITEAHVGFSRLQELLELRDYVHPLDRKIAASSEESIEMSNACLAWEVVNKMEKGKQLKDQKEENQQNDGVSFAPCLFDLNLTIKKGQLIGVAGGVGAGKTSLTSAIMGEVSDNL